MAAELKGKRKYVLKYEAWEHADRIQWIMANAQLTSPPDQMQVSEDGQWFEIEVQLDDVVYQRYLKNFEPEQFAEIKRKSK